MAAPVLRPLSTGEVLDVSFGLYRSLFVPLVIVAAVCRTAPLLLSLYLQPATVSKDPFAGLNMLAEHWMLWIVLIFLGLAASAFAVAATTSIVSAAYLGHVVTAAQALARATGVIGRLILVSLLTSFVFFLGFLVLIVPGIILISGLILSSVVLVLESGLGPIGAMNRSWELTKGFRWKVFVTVFVAALILAVPSMVVGVLAAVGSVLGTWPPLISVVLSGVLQIFAYPFLYVVITVLYYDLRVRKEGFDLELLATATHRIA